MEFQLTSAEILGDGLIARLQFESGISVGQSAVNRLVDTGFPDYLPAVYSNSLVTINDIPVEVIGVQSEDWNMPMPWIEPPSSGGSIASGTYFFMITLEDSSGNEIYVSPAIWGYQDETGELGTVIYSGQKLVFSWRIPCPVGGKVNIYACTQKPIVGNLQRVASVDHSSLTSLTSYILTSFSGDNALFSPRSTTWTVTCKLANPICFGQEVSINIPSNILIDEKGNYTQSVNSYSATNYSVVGSDGFLATPENISANFGSLTFNQTIYLSYSHGTDSLGSGTLSNPYKTVSYAMSKISSSNKNIRFCFLRGDVWPSDVWKRSYWGLSYDKPSLFDSYWNYSYGSDPETRPIITYGDPYYDLPSKNLDATQILWQQSDNTGQTTGYGKHPYCYFRGLSFQADTTYANTGPSWPTNTAEDWVVISDCEFLNVQLIGSYGSPQNIAPIGCMIHRCIIHQNHASPINTYPDTGSSGNSLVFPDRFINPWAGYASVGNNLIVPGQNYIRFFNVGTRWNISGWGITVSEGSTTETKILTTHSDGNGSYWNVNSNWSNTFTRSGCSISLDPTNQQFQILSGTGSGSTTYTIDSYDFGTRTATVSPSLPTVDNTTRIAFLPLGYWSLGGHIQGIFVAHCGDFLFSQNTFDKNGWNWFNDVMTYNDIYNHNIYLSAMTRNVVLHSNYILRANSVGAQLRGGGVCAYNVFAKNTHGNNLINGGMVYKNIYTDQGLYNTNTNTCGSHTPGHINDFNIFLKTRGALENGIPNQNYTGITCFISDEVGYAHSYISLRHNTYVDAGSIFIGYRLPVPGKLQVHNNLSVNRSVTGVDYQNTPLRTTVLGPLASNWQINGNSTVAASISGQVDWDFNAYKITSQNTAFYWPDVTTKVFSVWQSHGRDINGIAFNSDPSFVNGSYLISDYALEVGIGSNFDDFWANLVSRQSGVWNDYNDASNCYNSFANAYQPLFSDIPSYGRYFGATDYTIGSIFSASGNSNGNSTALGVGNSLVASVANASGSSTAVGSNVLIISAVGNAFASSSAEATGHISSDTSFRCGETGTLQGVRWAYWKRAYVPAITVCDQKLNLKKPE